MYTLKIALKSMLREKRINILTALTIGLALLVFSVTVFFLFNLGTVAGQLPEKFTVMVYVKDDIPESDLKMIQKEIETEKIVKSADYISKEKAFEELKKNLRGAEFILEGLEENPLLPSFEVRIRKELFSIKAVEDLSQKIAAKPWADGIDYGKGFLDFIHSFRSAMSAIGVVVAGLLFFSIIFVIYSTIKINFYRRLDEIETYKLLGATANFIRAPFLIEGGVIGLAGGVFGVLGSFLFYYALFFRVGKDLPLIQYLVFPSELFPLMPFIGVFLGLLGTVVAIGRVKF